MGISMSVSDKYYEYLEDRRYQKYRLKDIQKTDSSCQNYSAGFSLALLTFGARQPNTTNLTSSTGKQPASMESAVARQSYEKYRSKDANFYTVYPYLRSILDENLPKYEVNPLLTKIPETSLVKYNQKWLFLSHYNWQILTDIVKYNKYQKYKIIESKRVVSAGVPEHNQHFKQICCSTSKFSEANKRFSLGKRHTLKRKFRGDTFGKRTFH